MVRRGFCGKFKVGEPKEGVECMRTLQCFNLQVACIQRLCGGGNASSLRTMDTMQQLPGLVSDALYSLL
jgi:hypothetical protein